MQNIKNPVGQDLEKLYGVIFMKKSKRQYAAKLAVIFIFIAITMLLFVIGAYIYVHGNVDYSADEALFSSNRGSGATTFYYNASSDGDTYLARELCIYKGANLKKQWTAYDEIGDNLKAAFIAAEDRKFFKHHGVDFGRTALAFVNSFLGFKPKFGASTITQQVIKNISGDNEQTFSRKLNEIFRATHLENTHSKEEIFEVYMNIVPMGNGMLGVGMASDYYFGNTYGSSQSAVAKQKQQISKNMQKACKDVLKQSLGINPTDMEVAGLQKICIILQQCDSGAYTRLATIRSNGIYYTGGNDRFTQSFTTGENGMPRLKTFEENTNLKP
jgi:penicillin-binding protein 1A